MLAQYIEGVTIYCVIIIFSHKCMTCRGAPQANITAPLNLYPNGKWIMPCYPKTMHVKVTYKYFLF